MPKKYDFLQAYGGTANQRKQIGTAIVNEIFDYLQSIGNRAVRLAIDKGNPQSSHFWKKNGFEVISETDVNGWTKLVAERKQFYINCILTYFKFKFRLDYNAVDGGKVLLNENDIETVVLMTRD